MHQCALSTNSVDAWVVSMILQIWNFLNLPRHTHHCPCNPASVNCQSHVEWVMCVRPIETWLIETWLRETWLIETYLIETLLRETWLIETWLIRVSMSLTSNESCLYHTSESHTHDMTHSYVYAFFGNPFLVTPHLYSTQKLKRVFTTFKFSTYSFS